MNSLVDHIANGQAFFPGVRFFTIAVLLELPLPPFFNRFGALQRRLARRHGADVLPRRPLLTVLTTEEATLNTIHQ